MCLHGRPRRWKSSQVQLSSVVIYKMPRVPNISASPVAELYDHIERFWNCARSKRTIKAHILTVRAMYRNIPGAESNPHRTIMLYLYKERSGILGRWNRSGRAGRKVATRGWSCGTLHRWRIFFFLCCGFFQGAEDQDAGDQKNKANRERKHTKNHQEDPACFFRHIRTPFR